MGLFFLSSQFFTQVCIEFPLKKTVSLVLVFWVDYEINLPQVKTLFTVCLKLSQSKNILYNVNSTVYSCNGCVRLRRGLFFHRLSCIHKFA